MMSNTISMRKSIGKSSEEIEDALVLNCTDIPLHHWVIKSDRLEVFVNVNQIDLEPKVLIRNGFVFVGAEHGIFAIDMKSEVVVSAIQDVSYVQWIYESCPDYVVFSAEDEILVFDNCGNLSWRKNLPDVIERIDVEFELLNVFFMSGKKYRLQIASGKVE